MHLFWLAYTFLYATALWSHLGALGASYTNSVTARLGLPTLDISHFLLSAGLPLVNIPATSTNSAPTPILIEILAPTPIPTAPTSTRTPVPNTILFPASPLPTARLRHKALPLCYDGLHNDSVLTAKPATRTVTVTSTDLVVDSPGLIIRYLLVTSALATILGTRLIHSPTLLAAVCVLGLACLSRIVFATKRAAFKSAASRTHVSDRRPCSCNLDMRELTNPEGPLVTADTTSPSSLLSISPLKKLATIGPAFTKTDRLIARKQRSRGRKQVSAKGGGIPLTSRNDPPPLPPPRSSTPPEPVEMVFRVWTVKDGTAIEYTPLVPRIKKRVPPSGKKFADVD